MTVQITSDSVILRNQPVAKEGVLDYPGGRKLKRWEDLEKNIGRVVPILDEHPDPHNGAEGLYSGNETVHGVAKIKKCPRGNKKLCADLLLEDGAPIKTGYSIGYPYRELDEPGVINGDKYDQVQSDLIIDHVALTDAPRDDDALQVAPDSKIAIMGGKIVHGADSTLQNSVIIVINRVGHDSYRFKRDASYPYQEARDKLARDNPELSDQELDERAVVMASNMKKLGDKSMVKADKKGDQASGEEELPEEEEGDTEELTESGLSKEVPASGTFDSLSREQLLAELIHTKAEKHARDSNEKRLKALEKRLNNATDSATRYKTLYEDALTEKVQVKVDSLVREHGFDALDFKDQHAEFIAGALFASQKISRGPGGSTVQDSTGEDANEPKSINDYIYDFDSKKMVPTKREF